VLGGLIARRAFQLQIREADQLRGWAENNYLKETQIAPRRGRILDRKGEELASTAELDSVYCNPRQLAYVDGGPRQLAKALHMDPRELDKILAAKSTQFFAWLKRRVTPSESAAVSALKIPGVGMRKEPRRVYPRGELAATIIGHAGLEGSGLDGVELSLDSHLRGTGMEVMGMRDRLGRDMLVDGVVDSATVAGKDIRLTLDPHLTAITEQVLAETVRKHNAKAAMAVMMDVRTGEILAMANVPTYNPNDPSDLAKRGARNRIVTDAFEPGSTLKTFTFAAALDAGKLRPTDMFDCQMGKMSIGKFTIRDDHPKGTLPASDVFKYSSNIGTVKIARRIGKEALWAALDRFGFGQPSYVGLPGERRGTLHPVSRWGEIEFATNAFGQGLTVTPIQLAAAFAAIASYGIYHPPILAKAVINHDGTEEPLPRPENARGEHRVMSEASARTLLNIMQGVTEDGTAKLAAIPGYSVGGKTGTAQKVFNGRYDPSKFLASFVGIVPLNAPRLVVAVMVDEPQGIHYGGVVSAPAFKEIAEKALSYLGIAPTSPVASTADKGQDKRKDKGQAKLPEKPAVVEEDDGPGLEEAPAVLADGEVDETDAAPASPDMGEGLVSIPDFSGMSMGEAIAAARKTGVEIVPQGSGVASGQSPKPGKAPAGTLCRVSFRRQGG